MPSMGPAYSEQYDKVRIGKQMEAIRDTMLRSQQWFTLGEIDRLLQQSGHMFPQTSISANLRNLRKPQFGSYILEKRPRGNRYQGLWEYRLFPPKPKTAVQLELLRTA